MSDTIKVLHGPQTVEDIEVRATCCASPRRFYIARGMDQPVIRALPVTSRAAAQQRQARLAPTPSSSSAIVPPQTSDAPVRTEPQRRASPVSRFVRAAVERATR